MSIQYYLFQSDCMQVWIIYYQLGSNAGGHSFSCSSESNHAHDGPPSIPCQHLSLHASLTAKVIHNFWQKLQKNPLQRQIPQSSRKSLRNFQGDIWAVVAFFDKLKEIKPLLFCYSLKKKSAGQPVAIIWSIAEMQRKILRYSSTLFFDMGNITTNNLGWNYFDPTVLDSEI